MERMEIKLKECCLECDHFDLDYAKLNVFPTCGCTDRRKLACTHMQVCHKYIDSEITEEKFIDDFLSRKHGAAEFACDANIKHKKDLWFSVEDAMPKEKYDPGCGYKHSKPVIVAYNSDGKMRTNIDIAKSGKFFMYENKVTHWMPMPEPPSVTD